MCNAHAWQRDGIIYTILYLPWALYRALECDAHHWATQTNSNRAVKWEKTKQNICERERTCCSMLRECAWKMQLLSLHLRLDWYHTVRLYDMSIAWAMCLIYIRIYNDVYVYICICISKTGYAKEKDLFLWKWNWYVCVCVQCMFCIVFVVQVVLPAACRSQH